MYRALILSLICLAAAPQPARASGSADKSAEEKVICRQGPETYSRIPRKRICQTRREWELHDRQLRESMGEAQRGAKHQASEGLL